MSSSADNHVYRSIFSPSTASERTENFENYWLFSQRHAGEIFEEDRDLSNKREKLKYFQDHPVRSRQPLADPEAFYRNCVILVDDPAKLDRKTLLMTAIYKFARHEWVGVSGAWDATKPLNQARHVRDKISRYHLAEEFCHGRLFNEMFRTFHLDKAEWVSLNPIKQMIYKFFPHLPGAVMDSPAFVTELMGLSFYRELDRVFDDVLADEPEARERVRALLHEIMVDELAHIGQRRNFIGPIGIKFAEWMVEPMIRLFFRDIPESKYLFDIDRMVREAQAFDYSGIAPELLQRSWVPSYCQTPA